MAHWYRVLGALCLLWAGAAMAALPETPHFRHYGVAEGLPSAVVYEMAQDLDGYLWFATADGLARFDGLEWEVFRHDPADPDSIPGNSVIALAVGADNALWMGLEGLGLARLDPGRSRFDHFHGEQEEAFAGPYVWAVREDSDGALWVGTFQDGLFRRDPDGRIDQFRAGQDDGRGLPGDIVLTLAVDPEDRLWVGTDQGAATWNGSGFDAIDPKPFARPMINSINFDATGSVVLGQRGGAYLVPPGGAPVPEPVNGPETGVVLGMTDLGDGLKWFATDRGLLVQQGGRIDLDAYGDPALARAYLHQMFVDREGSLWMAGHGGAWQLAAGWQRFASFTTTRESGSRLSNEFVRGIAESADGNLWLVGASGLDRLDVSTGMVSRVDGDSFPEGNFWSVVEDDDGALWLGAARSLFRWHPQTGARTDWLLDDGQEGDDILAGPSDLLYIDAAGRTWIGNHGGGVQVRRSNGRLLHAIRPGEGGGLDRPDPEQIRTGPDGHVWLAGADGLHRWIDADRRFEPVAGGPGDRVFTFAWRSPDELWLHRFTALERYRFQGGELHLEQTIDGGQGLPAVESGGLLLDDDGGQWLSTTRGLLHRTAAGELRVYGMRDGLPGQEFSSRPMLMTSRGIGAASAQGGLVLFDPGYEWDAGAPTPLLVKRLSLRQGDEVVALDPEQPLSLRHDDRDLDVVLRLVSFVDPGQHRYRMRLSGHDADWIGLGSTGQRTFSRLESGSHELQMQAADASGRWSAMRSLRIEVLPPWWQTGWAWLGYGLMALLLLAWGASIYQARMRRRHAFELAEQQRQLAEQASHAKSEFLATLGHEVRTPMTGVLGMSELLLQSDLQPRQRGQVEAIHGAGQHLLRLVDDALDLARIEAGKLVLDVHPYRIRALVGEVCELLAPLAAKKALAFDCTFADDVPEAVLGDSHRVRQILLNLGSNAIKFTESGHVSIRSAQGDGQLQICVRDTGPGLSASQQARLFQRFEQAHAAGSPGRQGGSGLGLAISQELAAAMGGSIGLESVPGEGARFTLRIPLVPASAPDDAGSVGHARSAASGRGGLRVLLVEDDPTVAEVIVGLLQSHGHDVEHVPHGLAALSVLDGGRIDVGLVDLDLPGLHGIELARLIRAQGHGLGLIAITARADAEAEPATVAAGMDGFLRKPLSAVALAELVERVHRRCAGRQGAVGDGVG